jgi:hypothetical protein
MYDDKIPRYTRKQMYDKIAEIFEYTEYFHSEAFQNEWLNQYNNWPSPEQEERAMEKCIENFVS